MVLPDQTNFVRGNYRYGVRGVEALYDDWRSAGVATTDLLSGDDLALRRHEGCQKGGGFVDEHLLVGTALVGFVCCVAVSDEEMAVCAESVNGNINHVCGLRVDDRCAASIRHVDLARQLRGKFI